MPYEINVAYKGKHLFATHPRSASTMGEAIKVYKEISSRFLESDGYKVSVDQWESFGHDVTKEIENEL